MISPQWNQFYDHPRIGVGKKCAIYWRCAFTVIQNTIVIVISAEIEYKKVERVRQNKTPAASLYCTQMFYHVLMTLYWRN